MEIKAFLKQSHRRSATSYGMQKPEMLYLSIPYWVDSGTKTHTTFIDEVLAFVASEQLVVLALETHVHADHLSAGAYLRQQVDASQGLRTPYVGPGDV